MSFSGVFQSKVRAPILMNMKRELPPLTVVDPYSHQLQELEYLSPYEAHKTLGYYKEPAGIQVQQFAKLKEVMTLLNFCGKPR
jgi:hypothetical protein